MHGHTIVCGDDALAVRIIDELNNAELSVVPLQSPRAWRPRVSRWPTRLSASPTTTR